MRILVVATKPSKRQHEVLGEAMVPGLHQLKCFRESGHEVIWMGLGGERISDERVLEFLDKNRIEYLHFSSIPTIFTGQEIPLITRRLDVDVVLGGEIFDFFPLFVRLASPTSNYYSYTHQNRLEGAFKNYYRVLLLFFRPFANRGFKRIFVPVESTRNLWLRRGIKNLEVVPPGIDTRLFSYRENRISEELKILFVGRVVPDKGLDYLLRAASMLRCPYSLTIVGGGEVERYQKIAQALGCNATFAGQVKYYQLPEILWQHNVLVLPSITTPYWKEQFGQILVEAMATGRIVVGSDCGSIPEVVGDAGFIVQERTVKPLAEVLEKIWHWDGLGTMSKKARRRAEEYDIRKTTGKMLEIFEEDLASKCC